MAYTYKELKEKTVAQLREIAVGIEHEAVKGYSQLNKEHLLMAICTALGIEAHEHHEVKGLDKSSIKSRIKKLKKERQEAIEARDYKRLQSIRRQMKNFKRRLRKAVV